MIRRCASRSNSRRWCGKAGLYRKCGDHSASSTRSPARRHFPHGKAFRGLQFNRSSCWSKRQQWSAVRARHVTGPTERAWWADRVPLKRGKVPAKSQEVDTRLLLLVRTASFGRSREITLFTGSGSSPFRHLNSANARFNSRANIRLRLGNPGNLSTCGSTIPSSHRQQEEEAKRKKHD